MTTPVPWGTLFAAVGIALAAVALVMAIAFLIGRTTGKYSVIDAIWGPGFVVATLTAFLVSIGSGTPGLRWILHGAPASDGRRVKLAAVRCGAKWITSRDALRKFTAALQAATSSHQPVLLRIDSAGGHGMGSSISVRIEESATWMSFLFAQLGMSLPAS